MGARIKDVANEANVSIATVSRVINNVPLVNEETRQRVLDAIKKTGYKPNAIARSLKLQRTNTLGIIIHDITRSYYTLAVRGVEDVSSSYGYNIILGNSDSSVDKEMEYIDLFSQKQCDGIIYIGRQLTKATREKLISSNIPIVLGAIEDEEGDIPCVYPENEEAAYEMVEYIASMGHKTIGIINTHVETSYFARKRFDGFNRAVKDNNLIVEDEWMQSGDFNMKGGYECMHKILSGNKYPSAVFCANDDMAFGAIRAANEKGLKVPEDISISGFNNFEIGKWNIPAITSVEHYMYDLGAICARLMIKLAREEEIESKKVVMKHEIIKRESVKEV